VVVAEVAVVAIAWTAEAVEDLATEAEEVSNIQAIPQGIEACRARGNAGILLRPETTELATIKTGPHKDPLSRAIGLIILRTDLETIILETGPDRVDTIT
jgi:hypothetical protein